MTPDELSHAQLRASEFAYAELDRYRSYHDHKEAMGYGAATLFLGAALAAALAEAWPPPWLASHPVGLTAGITVSSVAVLIFVKWQLRRRRWAAMRVAGLERLLAKWITSPPSEEALAPWTPPSVTKPRWWIMTAKLLGYFALMADHLWPMKDARPAVDLSESAYPTAFVQAWHAQWQVTGTRAVFHEGLLSLALIAGYVLVLLRT